MKIIIFRQLTMTQCADEMFWVSSPTNCHDAFLQFMIKIRQY